MDVSQHAFHPVPGGTVNITPTASSQNVQIETALTSRHVRVANGSGVPCFIEFGGSAVTASTTTSMPVLANEVDVFSLAGPYVAVIAGAGTVGGSIYFTPGEGMD